eukprot:scaffold19161_cov31-Tisochrysis_lutea.AAC.2
MNQNKAVELGGAYRPPEAFLQRAFEVKEACEHKGYITGAQSMMLCHSLRAACHHTNDLEVKKLPPTLGVQDRARQVETIDGDDVIPMVVQARQVLSSELTRRFFADRPCNTRMVLACMSKQKRIDRWMTPQQCECDVAKSLYLKMLRDAVAIIGKTTRKRESPRLKKKRKLICDDSEDSGNERIGSEFSTGTHDVDAVCEE